MIPPPANLYIPSHDHGSRRGRGVREDFGPQARGPTPEREATLVSHFVRKRRSSAYRAWRSTSSHGSGRVACMLHRHDGGDTCAHTSSHTRAHACHRGGWWWRWGCLPYDLLEVVAHCRYNQLPGNVRRFSLRIILWAYSHCDHLD